MIYIIKTADDSAIKIGHTKSKKQESVFKRMSDLQVGNHQQLSLLHFEQGGAPKERLLHHVLNDYRLGGEWFDYSAPEVRRFIDSALEFGVQQALTNAGIRLETMP